MKQGIKTHSARGGPQEQAQGGGQPANPMSGGMAAHSNRGGGGGGQSASPPPGNPLSGSPFRSSPGANRGQAPGSNNGTSQGGDRR